MLPSQGVLVLKHSTLSKGFLLQFLSPLQFKRESLLTLRIADITGVRESRTSCKRKIKKGTLAKESGSSAVVSPIVFP